MHIILHRYTHIYAYIFFGVVFRLKAIYFLSINAHFVFTKVSIVGITIHVLCTMLFFFFFNAAPLACGNSLARGQTGVSAVT